MFKTIKAIRKQYAFDFTNCINKNLICLLQFNLDYDIKYWAKWQKIILIIIYGCLLPLFILGIIVCILQAWGNDFYHGFHIFICIGLLIMVCMIAATLILMSYWVSKMNNYIDKMHPLFMKAVKEGYLTNNLNLYPEIVQALFYHSKLEWLAYHPDASFKNPIAVYPYALATIFSWIKNYQQKYCNIY